MIPVLVFDIETIPDVDGLRRLHDHPASMSDAEVAAVRAGRLSLKASLQLTYLKDNPQRAQILRQAAEGAWSAEQVRAHVQTLTKPSRSASRPSLDDLKSRLTPEKLEDLNDVKRQQVERQLAKLIALLDS